MDTISSLAKSNIKSSKSKSILTVITIVLTTCLLAAVGIICANWGEVNANTAANLFGTHHVMFRKTTAEENKKLASHLSIDKMQVVKTVGTNNDKQLNLSFALQYMGNLNDEYITEVDIKEGNLPQKGNEVLISEGYMTALGEKEPKVGDTVKIKYESRKDGIEKEREFVVSGIVNTTKDNLESKNFFGAISKEYLMAEEYDAETTFTTYTTLKGGDGLQEYDVEIMVDEITSDFGISPVNVKINSEYLRSVKPDATVIGGGVVIALMIILSSMLVIYSIFYISVVNKVQEYGKIRAIGATKKQIKKLISKEGMKLAAIAIPIGLVLGYVVGVFATKVAVAGTVVETGKYDIIILIVAAIASVITVYLSLLKPMKIASKISPVEAMRYNGDDNGKAKDRKGYSEMNIPRLVDANIKRNKKRTAVTMVSLCLSGILFIVASAILNSINVHEMTKHGFAGSDMYVYLSNYATEAPENPDKELYSIQQDNPLTSTIERIENIEGVKDVKISRDTLVKEIDTEEWSSVDILDESRIKDEILLSGKIDINEIKENQGIILDFPYYGEVYGVGVGDKVVFEVMESGVKTEKEFTIMAITDNALSDAGATYVLPEEVYNELFDYDTNSISRIYVEEGKYEDVKKSIGAIVGNEAFLDAMYYDEQYALNEKAVLSIKLMAYALVIVIGIIGFINLINTMITSIVVRKKELGMLQAIGLSNKQFIQMIQREGLIYIGSTIAITLTLGNALGYIAVMMFKNNGANYATYSYPMLQTVLLVTLTVLAQVIISYSITKSFNKNSLVDRIRYSE